MLFSLLAPVGENEAQLRIEPVPQPLVDQEPVLPLLFDYQFCLFGALQPEKRGAWVFCDFIGQRAGGRKPRSHEEAAQYLRAGKAEAHGGAMILIAPFELYFRVARMRGKADAQAGAAAVLYVSGADEQGGLLVCL